MRTGMEIKQYQYATGEIREMRETRCAYSKIFFEFNDNLCIIACIMYFFFCFLNCRVVLKFLRRMYKSFYLQCTLFMIIISERHFM